LFEGPFIERPWTERERREFWKGCTHALVFILGFMMMKELNAPHRFPSRFTVDIGEKVPRVDVGDAACLPAHQYSLSANGDNSVPNLPGSFGGLPEAIPLPSNPITPDSRISKSPPTGIPASQIWTFNPSALSNAIPNWLHPTTLLSSLLTLLSRQIASQAGSQVGKVVLNKGSAVLASSPDIHGWDTVITNQKTRAGILSALKNVEEVSSSLHVQLSAQLFAKKARGVETGNEEQMSAIKKLEALQMQLLELKWHQYEIVRLVFSSKTSIPKAAWEKLALTRYRILSIYHHAATLASSSLENHILLGHSNPAALSTLHSLRTSMLVTGSQLVTHINGLEQNIHFVDKVAESLPWKTEKRNDW
jgi:hypothetical protein